MHDETTTVTHWHCERCQRSGQVEHAADAGAWEVAMHLIQDAHMEASDGTCGGFFEIRVSLKPVEDWSTS